MYEGLTVDQASARAERADERMRRLGAELKAAAERAERKAARSVLLPEEWARLPAADRKRRCAEALRDDDFLVLASLLVSHLMTFGRRGVRTSLNTLHSYRDGLKALMAFAPVIARKAHQMTPQDARRYVVHLQEAGRSPATIKNRLAAARAFVRAIRWCGMIDADPFEGVSVIDREPTRRHYWDWRQFLLGVVLGIVLTCAALRVIWAIC